MVQVFKTEDELNNKAAEVFCKSALEAVQNNKRFTVALTGGATPFKLYQLLSRSPLTEQIPWNDTYIFWGDERWVPLNDKSSNAKLAFDALLNHVPIPRDHIFPMWDKQPPEDFAIHYEELLIKHFGKDLPCFDLILLGMGEDGHTASLFPGTKVLYEQKRLVQAYYLPPQSMYRITLTAPCINAAKKILFLVLGQKKANALYEVLEGTKNPDKYPAQLIKKESADVLWLVDELASERLQMR